MPVWMPLVSCCLIVIKKNHRSICRGVIWNQATNSPSDTHHVCPLPALLHDEMCQVASTSYPSAIYLPDNMLHVLLYQVLEVHFSGTQTTEMNALHESITRHTAAVRNCQSCNPNTTIQSKMAIVYCILRTAAV